MAELTPSVVQQENSVVSYAVSGTPVQTETYLLKVTKAAQNDTIVMTDALGSSYTTDKIILFDGVTIPSGGDSVQEAPTIDDSDDEIVLPSATTGTTWVRVTYGL